MAAFEYQALDLKGKRKKGVIEGDSARHVRQRLKEQGLTPIAVEATQVQKNSQTKNSATTWKRGIRATDLALLTRQLSTLIQSGMPLESCLQAVIEQTEKPRIRSVLTRVRAKVTEGFTLADSMADYPHIFDSLFRSMISAGEKSGHLDMILSRLASYTENRQKMRSKLLQALIYPIVLVVFAVTIVAFLLAAVVPKIVGQFIQMGQTLPASTQLLLNMSHFVQEWGWLVLLLVLGGWALLQSALKRPHIRFAFHRRLMSVPMIGKIVRGLNTSRFARTLAICSSSSIPILDAMIVAKDVVENTYMKQKVQEAAESVREGASIRKSLQQTQLFPPMMLHMIASGEQSGELEKMLISAADNQDEQFEATVNIALGLFTPMLIALMAGLVLFIVMATLMPILEMNNLMTR
ncbi:type II secretion system inner membrane protein GspF [Vibrio mangrovi]|uniref:General secretion pathway protein F n=1 Tax=Vibrio mangrovi TaxID=474394 RepID=A0A1Y6IYR0_9VIBR|nr:type II secretion system inner membrane protein GspF [Vibrio mangrovi]MDW6002635.1 type II secretion system inner membrane protein GspF [Vibrio mangrovi]SMS02794.1 Type II secretion system protein F [Vibrio mangrovi]